MPNERKALTRRTSDNAVDYMVIEICRAAYISAANGADVSAKYGSVREIGFVCGRVNWVDLNCCDYVKSRLFEAEPQTPGTSEQIYCYWPSRRTHRLPAFL
jgi:hypothetical protein